MNQPKLFTALSLFGCALVPMACGSEFDNCAATRTCTPGSAGKAGGGAAGASGKGGAAGTAGSSAGSAPLGGASGTGGGTAGNLGSSGEGGDESVGGAAGNDTGGSGGSAGARDDAGEAGEAGRGEPPECDDDEDCNDDVYCNGTETCERGKCHDASEPFECENDDALNCSVRCEEGDGEARCVVEALDNDDDGYAAAACEAAPGDDCDDEDELIYPTAAEVCDGIDNDCDGRVDTNDGLVLAGESRPFEEITGIDVAALRGSPGIDGDTPFRAFVLGEQPGGIGVFSSALESSGALGEPKPVFVAEGYAWKGVHAAGGTALFGAMYARTGIGGTESHAVHVHADGATSHDEFAGGDPSDIVARSNDWVFAIGTSTEVQVKRYTTDGTIEPGPTLTFGGQSAGRPISLGIAAQGEEVAVIWQVNQNLLRWERVLANLSPKEGVSVGATGYQPDITAAAGGYAMAWTTGSGIGFIRYATNGEAACESDPVDLAFSIAGDLNRVALADTSLGTLALVTSETGKVVLVRFDEDCKTSAIVPVATTTSASSPAIAVSEGAVALAWTSRTGAIAYTRLVHERLCE